MAPLILHPPLWDHRHLLFTTTLDTIVFSDITRIKKLIAGLPSFPESYKWDEEDFAQTYRSVA